MEISRATSGYEGAPFDGLLPYSKLLAIRCYSITSGTLVIRYPNAFAAGRWVFAVAGRE